MSPERSFQMSSPKTGMKRKPEAERKAKNSREALRIPEKKDRKQTAHSQGLWMSLEMLRIPETERNQEMQHQIRPRSRGRIRIPDRCSRENRQIRKNRRKNRRVRALLKRTL